MGLGRSEGSQGSGFLVEGLDNDGVLQCLSPGIALGDVVGLRLARITEKTEPS